MGLHISKVTKVYRPVRLTPPPPLHTGSTTSSASESDSGGLHAGLCAQQSDLSENDTLVARLALQLMVTCLQNRPQALGRCRGGDGGRGPLFVVKWLANVRSVCCSVLLY